jgi:hypothetical protein
VLTCYKGNGQGRCADLLQGKWSGPLCWLVTREMVRAAVLTCYKGNGQGRCADLLQGKWLLSLFNILIFPQQGQHNIFFHNQLRSLDFSTLESWRFHACKLKSHVSINLICCCDLTTKDAVALKPKLVLLPLLTYVMYYFQTYVGTEGQSPPGHGVLAYWEP